MTTMKNPPHPGRIIREEFEALNLTVVAAAKALGVTRNTLTNLLTGKNGVSPEMAIRLSQVIGSTAETWLRLQMQYDLAEAMKVGAKIKLKRIQPEPA
jgi:addiction module HigA family antidote